MITEKYMKECMGKRIKVTFEDFEGEKTVIGKCLYFYQSEDEDEEPMIEINDNLINQSEIKTLEILEDEK